MRRTTWMVLGVGLLAAGLAFSFAPSARADELGAPPAGVAALDDEAPDAPEPMEPEAVLEEETEEETAVPVREAVPYEAAQPDAGVDPYAPGVPEPPPVPVVRDVPLIPPMWTGQPAPGADYVAVRPVPLAAPMRSTPGCCQPRDECGWALDACGKRTGRWELLVEGSLTCLDSPCGFLGEPVPAGTPRLDWGENDYCLGYGGRLTVSWRPSPRERLEVRGGYYGTWDDASRQTGAFGFSPPTGGVSLVGTVDLESEAELYGAELNYWHELGCRGRFRFDAGIGARWVHLDETATVSGLMLPTGAGGAFMGSDVTNDLFAAQFSIAGHWDVAPRWELSLLGKGLVGLMSSESEVSDVSVLSGGPHASSVERGNFGWGFEVEGRVLYRITPRLGVTLGAAALYLGEATRAHEAFDLTHAGTGAVQASVGGGDLLALTLLVGLHLNF